MIKNILLALFLTVGAYATPFTFVLDDFTVFQEADSFGVPVSANVERDLFVSPYSSVAPELFHAVIQDGYLDLNSGSGDGAVFFLRYNFITNFLPSNTISAFASISLVENDANPIKLEMYDLGVGFFNIPGSSLNVLYSFNLQDGPGSLTLAFTGTPGSDSQWRTLEIYGDTSDVPEPGYALAMGALLVGLYFVRK